MTHDAWHMTRDTWHMNHDTWHKVGVNILSTFQLPSSYGLGVMMFWRFGGKGSPTPWVKKVSVDQPRLHRVCYTLQDQYAESVDIKGGLLNQRVCTVKFPVVEPYFTCNTAHTEVPLTRMYLEVWWFWLYEMVIQRTSPVVKKSTILY